MSEERIFLDAQFLALALHNVDGIVQDPFDEKITQLTHEDVRFRKIAQRDRQRADVIMVAMRDRNRIQLLVLDQVIKGQTHSALALGMNTGVEQQAVSFDLDKPGRGADRRIRIEIGNPQSGSVPMMAIIAIAITIARRRGRRRDHFQACLREQMVCRNSLAERLGAHYRDRIAVGETRPARGTQHRALQI